MENALILARVLGPLLVIVSVGLLINYKSCQELAQGFVGNRSLLYLGGVMALAGGLITLQLFSAWRADWTVVITIMGWLMVLKGAALIIVPRLLAAMADTWARLNGVIVAQGLVLLVVGLWLSYRGFAGQAWASLRRVAAARVRAMAMPAIRYTGGWRRRTAAFMNHAG